MVVVPHGVADVDHNGGDAGPVLKVEICRVSSKREKRNAGIKLNYLFNNNKKNNK